MSDPIWTVVVPVKRLDAAKSRLRGAIEGIPHERLALALAQDTVTAAMACPAVATVLVVTDDEAVGAALGDLGARLVAEDADGLNAAFAQGAALVTDGPVAALTADLPSLRPIELAAALRAATEGAGERGFVADTPGTGTVLLTARAGISLDPRFGEGSAAAHSGSGARPLTGTWPTLRRDVDTAADLAAAAVLGLGRNTNALVRRLFSASAVER